VESNRRTKEEIDNIAKKYEYGIILDIDQALIELHKELGLE